MSIKLKEFELTWSWKSFENLSKEEVYEILSFRQSIFVVEQESWYLDADALDQESEHLIVKYKDKLIENINLLDISLENLIFKTDLSLNKISDFLGKQFSNKTKSILKKQKIPLLYK